MYVTSVVSNVITLGGGGAFARNFKGVKNCTMIQCVNRYMYICSRVYVEYSYDNSGLSFVYGYCGYP